MKEKFLDRITFVKSGQFYLFLHLFSPYLRGGFPGSASSKEPAWQCERPKSLGLYSWVGKIPWGRKWQPVPVFLPREPVDRGAWRAAVHRVAQSQAQLNMHAHAHILDALIHMVSDFGLFSIWDMKVGKVRALLLTAILTSVLWKHGKWPSDWH